MAGATGFEPATSAVTGQCSNQLRYAPAWERGQQDVKDNVEIRFCKRVSEGNSYSRRGKNRRALG